MIALAVLLVAVVAKGYTHGRRSLREIEDGMWADEFIAAMRAVRTDDRPALTVVAS